VKFFSPRSVHCSSHEILEKWFVAILFAFCGRNPEMHNSKKWQIQAKNAQLWGIIVAPPIVQIARNWLNVLGCILHISCKLRSFRPNSVEVMSITKQDTPLKCSLGHRYLTQWDIHFFFIDLRWYSFNNHYLHTVSYESDPACRRSRQLCVFHKIKNGGKSK